MLRAARSPKARAWFAGLSLFVVATTCDPRVASAGGPLGAQGERIQTSQYTLDLFQGPVLASSRVTGMAGAYAGLAEGSEGIPFNAAAASQRHPQSTTTTDYDLTAGVTFPSSIRRSDFDNNGHVGGAGYEDFTFVTLGALLQHNRFGIGTNISLQSYDVSAPEAGVGAGARSVKDLTIRVAKVDLVASYGFFRHQLHIGGGIRGAVFTAIDRTSSSFSFDGPLFGTYGIGAQGGVLWRPRSLPIRLGATIRSPIIASLDAGSGADANAAGDRLVNGRSFYLPRGVDLPLEVEWGVAVQIGRRPLNLPWVDEDELRGPEVEAERRMDPGTRTVAPHLEPRDDAARRLLRRRYRALPRHKLLISFGMLVTDATKQAVGVESMLTQVIERSGQRASVTTRLGIEAEVISNWLQLRAGSYLEPTRFRGSQLELGDDRPRPRLHGTAGFELRVVDWSMFGLFPDDNRFRISGAIDGAREYFGWSLGFGSWY